MSYTLPCSPTVIPSQRLHYYSNNLARPRLASRNSEPARVPQMFNARGDYGLADVYGTLPSQNTNGTCQPRMTTSMDASPGGANSYPTITVPRVSSEPSTIYCAPYFPSISESGMLFVLDYTPSEGEANIPITVNVELRTGILNMRDQPEILLRLVFGGTAVKTIVKKLPPVPCSGGDMVEGPENLRLRLHAFAPPHSKARFPQMLCVPLTIQAMDTQTKIVESFTFGTFTYWQTAKLETAPMDYPHEMLPLAVQFQLKRKREDDELKKHVQLELVAPSHLLESPKKAHHESLRIETGTCLVRTTASDANPEGQEAELKWVVTEHTPHPSTLEKKWSSSDIQKSRRLVRFKRKQIGNQLLVSCEVIEEDDYDEDDIVISCIQKQSDRTCWFTSVDVIYLLERLVASPFSVEEKNRIRRNLEGLKPVTVSKTRPGSEALFHRIMNFPPPKPRNIEKDVKVFPWSKLEQALDKIIQKYSVMPLPLTDSPPMTSQDSPSSPSSDLETSDAREDSTTAATTGSMSGSSQSTSPSNGSSSQLPHPAFIFPPPVAHAGQSPSAPEQGINLPILPIEQHTIFPTPADDELSIKWRRRVSLAASSSTSEFSDYGINLADEYDTHTAHADAFSNPYACNVTFAAPALISRPATAGPECSFGHVTPISTSSSHAASAANLAAPHHMNDPYPDSRRSSIASELVYADDIIAVPQDGLTSAFGMEALDPAMTNGLLYTHYSSSGHL